MSQDLCRCGNISLLVYLLVILFGVSSWVDINGLWVELPILVQNLPEGWDLPSYMAVIIQIANVAPLAYTVASTIYPHRAIEVPVIYLIISTGAISCLLLAFFWDKTAVISGTEHSAGLFILQFFLALVDCTSSVAFLPFMTLFKPQYMTAYFIGEGFSGLIPSLVSLGQGAGSMECVNFTSTHLVGHANTTMSSYLNGTSMSASSSSFVSDTNYTGAENVTYHSASPTSVSFSVFPQYQPPRFTIKVFFLILMGLLILSALAFTSLNYWSYCKTQYVAVPSDNLEDASPWLDTDVETESSTITSINSSWDMDVSFAAGGTDAKNRNNVIFLGSSSTKKSRPLTKCSPKRTTCKGKILAANNPKSDAYSSRSSSSSSSSSNYAYTLSKTSVSGSSSGSSEISHSKKPPMLMSKSKYLLFMALTAWLCALSNGVLPAIQTYSCLPYGIQPYHLSVTLASIANPVACFATFFLKMTSVTGTVVMSLLSTALSAFVIFTAATSPEPPLVNHTMGAFVIILSWVLVIFLLTYTKVAIATMCRQEGRKALLWVGANTQLGSLIGAVIIFVLINNLKLFRVANPCV